MQNVYLEQHFKLFLVVQRLHGMAKTGKWEERFTMAFFFQKVYLETSLSNKFCIKQRKCIVLIILIR
jgi:hypothetical protein